jgi:pyruvate/2-oxoglutarate dehydrogenase complex dihydrolipoamide acyltransferase (E2) component
MPQVNVNDDEVTLVSWLVDDRQHVEQDAPLCEVETSKAIAEVPAPQAGIVQHASDIGEVIAVNQIFAYIGPTAESITAFCAQASSSDSADAAPDASTPSPAATGKDATAGAMELARKYSVDVADVPASGARIRRDDVQAYIDQHGLTPVEASSRQGGGAAAVPAVLKDAVEDKGLLSDHQWAIAQQLTRTQQQLITAHVAMDVDMSRALSWMQRKREAGMMTGPIPAMLLASARMLAVEPRLASFRIGRQVYSYRQRHIAYTARSHTGRLYTPVVQGVDQRPLDDLARECARLSMDVFRDQVTADMLSGACLTVSILSDQPVAFHIGLQNAWQSALLTIGAWRADDGSSGESPAVTRVVLSYDHGLLDGFEAAGALEAFKHALEDETTFAD